MRSRDVSLRLSERSIAYRGFRKFGTGRICRTSHRKPQRVRYVAAIRERDVSDRRMDPNDTSFDPLKAAIVFHNQGSIEEAFWMVFFFVQFGKHKWGGWRFAREIYGRLGDGGKWDWVATSADPEGFREWLGVNGPRIRRPACLAVSGITASTRA